MRECTTRQIGLAAGLMGALAIGCSRDTPDEPEEPDPIDQLWRHCDGSADPSHKNGCIWIDDRPYPNVGWRKVVPTNGEFDSGYSSGGKYSGAIGEDYYVALTTVETRDRFGEESPGTWIPNDEVCTTPHFYETCRVAQIVVGTSINLGSLSTEHSRPVTVDGMVEFCLWGEDESQGVGAALRRAKVTGELSARAIEPGLYEMAFRGVTEPDPQQLDGEEELGNLVVQFVSHVFYCQPLTWY